MSKKAFSYSPPPSWAKEIEIQCPGETFRITVDYDDVDRDEVDAMLAVMVDILNAEWPKRRMEVEARINEPETFR